ncbi:hypothetical protein B9Z19DRAFT_1118013 [Tuber borchii]|uniref:Uncharacterized protein n=1 Tax=Tuber borchii TaxID=42251 RepID=A0A2T7A9R0_TUBBO|nr:hypothetical protein B9Z19DRAFT_1118013 [Tuber borchii]
MSASTKIWATMNTFGKWAQKNPTLTASLGGTGLLIASQQYGRWSIGADINNLRCELAAIDSKITAISTSKLADLQPRQEFTKRPVFKMKAIDDDKTEMGECVKDGEKPSKCIIELEDFPGPEIIKKCMKEALSRVHPGEDRPEVDNCGKAEMGESVEGVEELGAA